MNHSQALTLLRQAFRDEGIDGYLQPVHDEFMNEYPPACNRRVAWLTGFSGSAGMLAVLQDKAALFVDGRYTLQAAGEVDTGAVAVFNSAELTPEQWLGNEARGQRIGYDPRLATQRQLARWQRQPLQWVAVDGLVDRLWMDRPAFPATPVFVHEVAFSGEDHAAKRSRIAAMIADAPADAALITMPDSLCWLLNLRARDVEQTPLLLAPLLIDSGGRVSLFVDPARIDAAVRGHLGAEVSLLPPSSLEAELQALGKAAKRVLVDPATLPLWHRARLADAGAVLLEQADPCQLPKACKNDIELQGMRSAHQRDGVAVIRLLHWLDVESGKRSVTEIEVVERLLQYRKEGTHFVEPSFNTIAGSGPNGAIVHYRADATSNRALQQGELFLLDSGGQYHDGTTDITRTVAIGTVNAEAIDRFTRVLKGHISLATARFPQGTTGSQLDALARQYLWQAGLDYDHGTGHGVGCFLGVHEGPQRISKRGGDAVALKPGMVVSNEPGYYQSGQYGIRIENLVAVREESPRWLAFETLTCVPIDTRLVDHAMLSSDELFWLNDYHEWVLATQQAHLPADTFAWLKLRCAPI
jgi:Xaa-Pro aminopeptidase